MPPTAPLPRNAIDAPAATAAHGFKPDPRQRALSPLPCLPATSGSNP